MISFQLNWITDQINIGIGHLKILFRLHYFRQCIEGDQRQRCAWSIQSCGGGRHGVRRSKPAGLVIRGGQLPLVRGSFSLASKLPFKRLPEKGSLQPAWKRLRRRQLLSSAHRGSADPWGVTSFASSKQTNIQGGRMNRVDIQIVPDDEGYREVGNHVLNFR